MGHEVAIEAIEAGDVERGRALLADAVSAAIDLELLEHPVEAVDDADHDRRADDRADQPAAGGRPGGLLRVDLRGRGEV
jgi:hypothetical protein